MAKDIQNLSDLRKYVPGDTIKTIFIQYVMEMIAEAEMLKKVQDILDNGGSVKDIQSVFLCSGDDLLEEMN